MQNLDKTDIGGLEYQIDTLLRSIHRLRLENSSLSNKLSQLERELNHFEEKNHHTVNEIDKIISQLKEEMA